jgi:phosphonate transport system substrate-binding protein
MVPAASTKPMDGYGLLAPEYYELRQTVLFDQVALSVLDGRYTQAYVLLVRKDSGWDKIDQLRGHSLVVLQTPRMSLAFIWLDVLLAQNRLPAATDFFDRVTTNSKPAQVGLPVFFHKADACLLTRQSYDVLAELNPQLQLQLRVVAESPELVPSLIAFRADHPLPQREQVFQEIRNLHDTPAGQQILALFQTEGFVIKPVSCLAPTLELITRHQKLCGTIHQPPGPAESVIAQHSQPPS